MAIHLSDIAAARVQHFLDNRGKGLGLRLGVKTTGCSGLAYVIEFVDELQEGDDAQKTVAVYNVHVSISPVSEGPAPSGCPATKPCMRAADSRLPGERGPEAARG